MTEAKRKMKKFIIGVLTLVSALTLVFGIGGVKAVYAVSATSTRPIFPASYTEYLSLSSPVDVWASGNRSSEDYRLAIAEQRKIHVYLDGEYISVSLPEAYSVSKLSVWRDYVFFLSGSGIYYFDANEAKLGFPNIVDTGKNAANSFIISGNELVANPSGFITFYELEEDNGVTVNEKSSVTVKNLTPSCLFKAEGSAYYFYENKLYLADGSKTAIANSPVEPRYAVSDGGIVYISSQRGVYSLELSTGKTEALIYSSSSSALSLGSLYEPQGLAVSDGLLYVCDSRLDAVSTIDLKTGSLTNYAISDRGELPNRISSRPQAIAASDDFLFILDENKIKAYEFKSGEFYSPELSAVGADKIAANKNHLLVASGDDLSLYSFSERSFEKKKIVSDLNDFHYVQAVCSYDKYFYFVNNVTSSRIPVANVYRLNCETGVIEKTGAKDGVGALVSADVFGKIYLTILNDGSYSVFGADDGKFTADTKAIVTTAKKPLASFVDIESKLYLLTDGNLLYSYDEKNTSEEYSLLLSDNLPDYNAVDACLAPATDKAYFLFNGFILSTDEINASTPEKLGVPENFDVSLTKTPSIVTIKQGAKLFNVHLAADSDGYLDYVGYGSETESREYLVVASTERYYLVTDGEKSAVVRKSDSTLSTAAVQEKSGTAYLVTDSTAYSYPLTSELFSLFAVKKNTPVALLASVVVNGRSYSLIDDGSAKGYVPSSMLKEGIASESSPFEFHTATVSKDGAKTYLDKEMTQESGTLAAYEKIRIYSDDGTVATVLIDGELRYIPSSQIIPRGYYAIRYLLVVVLLVIALFSTSYYLLKTRVFAKKED